MMKKLLSLSALFLCSLVAWAQTFTVDGITYNITSTTELTVEVSRGTYSGDIVIPEKVTYEEKDYSVTSIGEDAFSERGGLTSVTIANSVTSIGNGAFRYCSGLRAVTIPNSVTFIGEAAFQGCSGLTTVTIPNSVNEIGGVAFGSCWYLTEVTIPSSVTKIGSSAFNGCSSLTSVHITDLGAWCKIAFVDYESNPLYRANRLYLNGEEVKDLVIPNSVTSIGEYAFYNCSGLTSVTIPNSVISIGQYAFTNCSGLTSVTIPNSVTNIGDHAFQKCSDLASIKVDNGNVKYDSRNNCNAIIETSSNKLIVGCKSTSIPNSVTSIGNWAFASCSGLTSVTIPNSVISIGQYAFTNCSGLTEVTIPNSVASIERNAFSGCSGLTSVTIPNSVTSIGERTFSSCSGLTSVTIPNSVISIGQYAFTNCSGLTEVTIPNSVASIERYAFFGCSGLTSLTIPNSVTSIGENAYYGTGWYNAQNNGLLYLNNVLLGYKSKEPEGAISIKQGTRLIADNAFQHCSGLTSVTIPSSVTSIGSEAFYNCRGLTSVTIPNSVTSIGGYAFSGCSGLTSVTIPNSVTTIENHTFHGCSGLTSVTIPNSVTSIGIAAFMYCSGLTSVTIPNSVTTIGSSAFSGCSGLTEIYSLISDPISLSYDCWRDVNKDIPLYVPAGSKTKYQQAYRWNRFTNIIELGVSTNNVLAIDDLTGYVGKTVSLPILMNNVQQITGLQFDLVLPEGVTVAKKANGKNDITVTERMEEDYSLSSNTMDDGSVRVTGLSGESIPFTGNSGAIVNVVLQVDESVAEGDYQILVKNIVLSDVNGVAHEPVTVSCMLTVKSYVPGDVDDSGDININDAVCIVNYILNKPNAKFIPEAADLDGSGDININDAVVLINKYILKRANAKAMKAPRRAATGTDNYLSIGAISIKPGETKKVSVDMANTEGIQGLQCSIDLPEGLSFATKSNGKIDISNNTDRGDGFTLSSSLQEDGSLTVATVNFEGDSYYGNSGTIFTFKIKADENIAAGEYEIKVRDIVLSSGVAIKPSDASGKVTVSNSETGLQKIESDSNQSDSIYNLNGQRVNNPSRGIYIVNGRKVIVK